MKLECAKRRSLYDRLECVDTEIDQMCKYLTDCGYLLHRFLWDPNETFVVIFGIYPKFVPRHFEHNMTLVFDSYSVYKKILKLQNNLIEL